MMQIKYYLLLLLLCCTSIGYGQKNLFHFSSDADIGYLTNNFNTDKNSRISYDLSLKAGVGMDLNKTTKLSLHLNASYVHINIASKSPLRFPVQHDGRGGWIDRPTMLVAESHGFLFGPSLDLYKSFRKYMEVHLGFSFLTPATNNISWHFYDSHIGIIDQLGETFEDSSGRYLALQAGFNYKIVNSTSWKLSVGPFYKYSYFLKNSTMRDIDEKGLLNQHLHYLGIGFSLSSR